MRSPPTAGNGLSDQVSSVSSPTRVKPGSGIEWLSGSSRDDLRWTTSSGTKQARLERADSGCGVSPRWCGEDPAACRVGSEGLKQRGRQPIRRGVRGGSPALQLRALLIRRSRQTVQGRPLRSIRWADVPPLSALVGRSLVAWQQCWQQSAAPWTRQLNRISNLPHCHQGVGVSPCGAR
jgi:hypothetical protein